jgi:F-type H+-transporting ATPase subunit delta
MAEKHTVARPYAEAVFALGVKGKSLDGWSKVLQDLSLVVGFVQIRGLIGNPLISKQQLYDVVIEICAKSIEKSVKQSVENFIRLLVDNNRLLLTPYIAELFELRRAEINKTLSVQVVCAYAMNKQQQQMLSDSLHTKLDRAIDLSVEKDANLIGGFVVHAGDLVIDASVIGQLSKFETLLSS